MIKVNLIAHTNAAPLELATHAALKCYQAQDPQWGKMIDVENRLFNAGHHTTLQHFFLTFSIEGIAVGDITFGMHLTHPFYNSDQRSGRYCAKMFLEPDFGEIEKYIKKFWPEITAKKRKEILGFIKYGVGIYHSNIDEASLAAAEFLKYERPMAGDKYIEMNAPKIAQEQMRMFIPVIFPTGFDFTINLTVLAAMYRIAWTAPMRFVTGQMVAAVIHKFPELAFMFSKKEMVGQDWAMEMPKVSNIKIKYKPAHKLLDIISEKEFIAPGEKKIHPVDLLHFDPAIMNNSSGEILTETEISVATMGQDQRHRTIRRSQPRFTGNFYLPPIGRKMKLEKEAENLMNDWIKISKNIPKTLAMVLAPYGAMVKYKKSGSFNAVAHEQAKRLCFCAQEEIYHAGRALRMEIEKKRGKKPASTRGDCSSTRFDFDETLVESRRARGGSRLLTMFKPPCYKTGKCAEGGRYCGRDIKLRKAGNYFPERKV